MNTATISRFVTSLLPPDAAAFVHKHALRGDAPLQVYFNQARVSATRSTSKLYPYVQPYVEKLLEITGGSEVAGLLVPLGIVAVALIVLNWIRRALLFWTRMAVKAVFWASVAALAAWVWQRGLEESARDVVLVGGKIAGYAAVVKDIWLTEYKKYEGQQNMGRKGSR